MYNMTGLGNAQSEISEAVCRIRGKDLGESIIQTETNVKVVQRPGRPKENTEEPKYCDLEKRCD